MVGGVFTCCASGRCKRAAEYDGYGGLLEPGWEWVDSLDGWTCMPCRASLHVLPVPPITLLTFPC